MKFNLDARKNNRNSIASFEVLVELGAFGKKIIQKISFHFLISNDHEIFMSFLFRFYCIRKRKNAMKFRSPD